MDTDIKKVLGWSAGAVIGLFLFVACFSSFYTVGQREAVVLTHWGKFVSVETAGLHWKMPFADSTTEYSIATQQVDLEKSTVNTSDNQKAYITMLVQFDIPPDGVKVVYEKYPNYEQRIYSLASDTMKINFGKYQVMDIPSKRGEIESQILSDLSKEAKRLYGANITEVQIKDIGYTDAFENSIDRMTKAKADVEQAQQKQLQAKIDAQNVQIEAEGQANAAKAQAQGEAESIELKAKANADQIQMEGEAQAKSIKAQTDALNASPQFVNYTAAKAWNGQLPTSIGVGASSTSIPMLNLGSVGK